MAITRANIIVGGLTQVKVGGTDVGATKDGAALTKTPEYFEHEVDQFLDAVDLTPTNCKMEVELLLSEATLANLYRVWNEIALPSTNVLNLGIDTTTNEFTLDLITKPTGASTTRTYHFFRAVSFEASSHSLKKDDRVAFPVKFRILPDIAQAAGSEYGFISDT